MFFKEYGAFFLIAAAAGQKNSPGTIRGEFLKKPTA
jgi:hypothetical protein